MGSSCLAGTRLHATAMHQGGEISSSATQRRPQALIKKEWVVKKMEKRWERIGIEV